MPRTGVRGCNNNCVAPRCKGLSKRSIYRDRCCLCTRHASGLCHWHQRYDGPETTTRKPSRAATVGGGVTVAASTIRGAGNGLYAAIPFASSDIITRYQPFDRDHNGQPLLTRQEARVLRDQRWICQKDGNYISGIQQPVRGLGGGSFCNDNGGPYNAELFVHQDRMNHIYLRVIPGQVILPGREIFLNYGTGRSVAMGNSRL